ncbi:hypothetical protein CC80DRAFT_552116 [Byssothecium circinans]|uniref:Uncharacterized protein n=1 Tax=Byssothecium circinans TaxID=147558 RepID=A0A6A5TJS8_9PLEO|nr:hypothetical protein CC80DRAFT_552116 [Byssothecium circinans]
MSKKKPCLAPPAANGDTAVAAWDTDDSKAMVMLLSSVHDDLTMSIASCDTSPAAWEHFANRFDRGTATLPDTMDTIIDNLSTRNLAAFQDIEPKVLSISEMHSLASASSSTAYGGFSGHRARGHRAHRSW